jgi:general secretion pathway protein J
MIRQRLGGFTLIELLVALSIFGLVSLIAFSGLDSSLKSRERIEQQADRLSQLQKSFHLMRQDFEHAVPRAVRDQLGDLNPKNAFVPVENGLLFTRGGRENPLNIKRSNMERIGWGIKENKLVRARWQALDQPNEQIIDEVAYLEDVEALSFRYMGEDRRWIEQWPPLNTLDQGPELPRAVEINVTLSDLGDISRIFLLPF